MNKKTIKEIFLINDHDEALKVWREKKIKNLDVVHIDAHIDFNPYSASPVEKAFKAAENLEELKRDLEYSLAYLRYEKDFSRQTNIGNYIYPAMKEGIVDNFYWVIPGGLKEFKASIKNIKLMFKDFAKKELGKSSSTFRYIVKKGIILINLLERRFIVCILDKLPILRQFVLLDIDTDFLVIDSLSNAANTINIGKRKVEVHPQYLVKVLKQKIKRPRIITIVYSVNGGYTSMKYKCLGDEIAYYFDQGRFKKRYEISFKATEYFNLFVTRNKKKYYWEAVKLDSSYRSPDNNYGRLYLFLRKFSLAQKEFLKILDVDPFNPGCLLGLGVIALEKKDFIRAKRYFSSVLNSADDKLFIESKEESLSGLAKAEFNLKNFDRAKELLFRYQAIKPLVYESYYFLGRVFEQEKKYHRAAYFYKDAIRLGFNNLEVMSRLLRIWSIEKYKTRKIVRVFDDISYMNKTDDIIFFLDIKYQAFKKEFSAIKRLSLKQGKKIKGLYRVEKRVNSIGAGLNRIYKRVR